MTPVDPPQSGPATLIVGYRTRPVADALLEALTPAFTAARNLKDPAKIAADVEAKREAYFAEAADRPYTGTFDALVIWDVTGGDLGRWRYAGREPGGENPPVAAAAAAWLLKRYPTAWSGSPFEARRVGPAAVFLGFDPRRFLKMLGTECSLPEVAAPLPPRLWYGNADVRDIGEAVLPSEFKALDLAAVIRRRRPVDPEAAVKYDELLADWRGPHHDPERDVLLACELAAQLGFLGA